jgi:antitoxin ParD1/3/4
MGVIRKSITFTEQQDTYIKSLIEKGFYTNDSEYVRDIIRKDQENRKSGIDLYDALVDGIESGVSKETVDSIWEQSIEANGGRN